VIDSGGERTRDRLGEVDVAEEILQEIIADVGLIRRMLISEKVC
jgi:hypothetical protein